MSSIRDELQLFHSMLKKVMGALAETVEMYEDYIKIHSEENGPDHSRAVRVGKKQREPNEDAYRTPTAPPLNPRLYEEQVRREELIRELQASGQSMKARKTLSCKQRLSALKTMNKHIEKQHEPRHVPAAQQGKKNTAFFLYLQQKRESMAREYPELNNSELTRIIADNWKAMGEEERKPFYRENLQNRKEFDKSFQKCLSQVLTAQRTDRQHQKDDEDEEGQEEGQE